ncbi:hypothetical protein ACIPUB_11810 [Paeniglutamicibacter sp. ORCA_105]|uniref:hypothetical protein n=1 Tax=Paeniglutamicibacter sp. ORCA_105 TaxID=3377336 RepID=UPI003895DF45
MRTSTLVAADVTDTGSCRAKGVPGIRISLDAGNAAQGSSTHRAVAGTGCTGPFADQGEKQQ